MRLAQNTRASGATRVEYTLPAILSICLLFITPDVEFRYVLPFVYFVPVFYAYIFRKRKNAVLNIRRSRTETNDKC